MTVCIVTDGFPPQVGGISTFNQHLVSLLLSTGHNVIVLFKDSDSNEDDTIISEGSFTKVILKKSYQYHYKKWQPFFRPGGLDVPNWIAMGIAMKEWLVKNQVHYNIDIIEVSDYGGCGFFLCDSSLPPIVITGHGSLVQFSQYNYLSRSEAAKIIRKLEKLSFVYADAVIAHSYLNKEDLHNIFKREISFANIPWQNKTVLTNSPLFQKKIVVVSGLQPIKGVYTMAAAMEILKSNAPEIVLNWIGGDTWMAPAQQLMSPYLHAKYPAIWQKTFIWKNELPHEITEQEIETAALIIIPAIFETFNYIALEAAALKKAIIITDKTGASFLFTHGVDAWIVPANNPKAIADAILYLINNPGLCSQLGEKAYQTLHQIFIPEKIIKERMMIYNSVIQNRATSTRRLQDNLSFPYNYRTSVRKCYYCIRQFIKKLIGRG